MSRYSEIKFVRPYIPRRGSVVLFVSEGLTLGTTATGLNKTMNGRLLSLLKSTGFEGKKGETRTIYCDYGKLSAIIFIGLGDEKSLQSTLAWRDLGALCQKQVKSVKGSLLIALDTPGFPAPNGEQSAAFALGFRLACYRYDFYKTKDTDKPLFPTKVSIGVVSITRAIRDDVNAMAIADGVFLARDLVNEPANSLGPQEFAERALSLVDYGCDVKVLNESVLQGLSMNAMLAVGRGSERPPRLVVIEYKQAKISRRSKPVVLVGKGVVFDSGGISIKPAASMEDMKGDMGGAAAVIGTMMTLAKRQAKAHVIGLLALAENMPDGKAYRPGDIITSKSGQTIEIVNTDAEGRLVLADALTYAEETFQPAAIIDLATLTGAILVALGHNQAGLFSSSDQLRDQLSAAALASGDYLWPMPLGDSYNTLINSTFADMKNSGGRMAGSITAAQFLNRFINKSPWAHIDIAGTAMGAPKTDVSPSWASGYGVQLLNRLIADYYE